jgi:dipeptide transport system permease protein
MDPARRERLLHEFGLDRPLPVQYLDYVWQVLKGNLGTSLTTHEPVLQEFLTLFPATIELALCAMLLSVLVGLPAGVLAAVKRNSVADYAVMGVALTGYSMPIFWWALLLILFFSVQLGWTPVSGRIAVEFDVPATTGFLLVDAWRSGEPGALRSTLSHLILPSIALGTIPLAVIARMTRSSMLEVLREDYVRTARAKGLSRLRVIVVHALRNALIPVITVIGLQVGLLLSGAILTETIFSWPGVGNWLVHGVLARDYPVVQGGILLIATIVITVNLIVDLLYGVVNPRIHHG